MLECSAKLFKWKPTKPHGVTKTNRQPRPFTIKPFPCVLSQVLPQKTWLDSIMTCFRNSPKPQDCPQYPIIASCLLFKWLPHASPIRGKPELALIPPAYITWFLSWKYMKIHAWKLLLMGAVGFVVSCSQQRCWRSFSWADIIITPCVCLTQPPCFPPGGWIGWNGYFLLQALASFSEECLRGKVGTVNSFFVL